MRIPWFFQTQKRNSQEFQRLSIFFQRVDILYFSFPWYRDCVSSFSRFSAEIRDAKNRRRFHSSDETRCRCVLVRAWYIYWSCGIKRLRVALWERRWKRWRSTSACRLKRFSISARAFDAHYQAFLFYSGARYIHNPFRSNGTPMPRLKPPAFLICLGHIVVLRLTKSRWQDSIN